MLGAFGRKKSIDLAIAVAFADSESVLTSGVHLYLAYTY
jgi:hypothetical protein